MNVRNFCEMVVRPTLAHLGSADYRLNTRASEQLILGTALAESGLREIRQQPDGPALTFMQIEPSTRQDIDRYLDRADKAALCAVVDEMRPAWPVHPDRQIVFSMGLAVAYARIRYWYGSPKPMPKEGDEVGMAQYWLSVYNAGGKGTMTAFARPFREQVLPLY